jgi:hypothetical protein
VIGTFDDAMAEFKAGLTTIEKNKALIKKK